ncbi:MAG: ATP phosphoribosyltransferase regulatory subunit [Rhodospirillaceae bacterium]|nr:ATP phosphoribosyltransferase regulatory subunit [Rhodospirillaceae bacterium]
MSDPITKTLLPEGLRDLLPPDAAFEAATVDSLCRSFAANGYELVKPPLVEFEDALLSGVGAPMAARIFRMLDPASHRTLGMRADITTQIARIAGSRLAAAPRPLRLMYAGPVLRVQGTQLEPERQFTQAGLELIGVADPAADAEAIVVTVEALRALGVGGLTVDLSIPTLVRALVPAMSAALRDALDHKDIALIAAHAGAAGAALTGLVAASGPFDRAAARIAALSLPPAAAAEWAGLAAVAQAVKASLPDLILTVDPVENRGFEYHSGITFSIFAAGSQREIGRGGRYLLPSGEPATGATLLVEPLLAVAPRRNGVKRVYAPAGTDRAVVRALQADGWAVVGGLTAADAPAAAAARLGCSHVIARGAPVAIAKS